MNTRDKNSFRKKVYDYYRSNFRPMPWRESPSPYYVFVSEIMLQQTQVERVLRMFPPFVKKFPDFKTLACADLADVYELWKGLGYNRRAKYLRDAARLIVDTHRGRLPDTVNALTELPGVGKNTAAAIIVYAYSIPVPYIETNIRTVYIHHFFSDREKVSDNDILTHVNATIDTQSPRNWFWALMDYGTHLKKTRGNASRKSTAYRAQSTFAGSDRKLRGLILQTISEGKRISTQTLRVHTENDPRTDDIARKLVKEGLIREECGIYRIGE